MGNSHGVLIPKPMLAELGLAPGASVDLKVKKGRLVIEAAADASRRRWAEEARLLAAAGEQGPAWPPAGAKAPSAPAGADAASEPAP